MDRDNGSTIPTVIVSRRARAGSERAAEAWLRDLSALAAQAPGHLGADVQPPSDHHPGDWVIIYRFESVATLDDWLASPRRAALIEQGRELIDGDTREQIVATVRDLEPVTAVASFHVAEGSEDELRERYGALREMMSKFPGFLRVELFEPVPGVQEDAVITFSFVARDDLDRWLESPDRRAFLASIDPLLDSGRTLNVVGGFGGWFARADAPAVKTWKQASIVLLALFPTALTLGLLRRWLLPDIGFFLGTFIGNAFGVAILSWVLMPRLTKLFRPWLQR